MQIRSLFIQSFPVSGLPYCFYNSLWDGLGLGLFCLVVCFFLFYITKMLMRDCLEQLLSAPCSSLLVCGFAPIISMKKNLLDVLAPPCTLAGCIKVGSRYWGVKTLLWLVCLFANNWLVSTDLGLVVGFTLSIWESCPWMHNYYDAGCGTFQSAFFLSFFRMLIKTAELKRSRFRFFNEESLLFV